MTRRFARARASLLAICAVSVAACSETRTGTGEPGSEVERGRQLLARYHCGTCHTIPGVPAAQGRFAASLQGYGLRSYIAGRVANQPTTLARWIVEPAALVPGTLMPSMGVAPDDAQHMATYLGQLR